MPNVSLQDIYRLAAEACLDERTVKTVLRGGGSGNSRKAILDSARRLAIVAVVDLLADGVPYRPAERAPLNIRAT